MRLSLIAIYEGGGDVGSVPLLRTSNRALLRIVAEGVLAEAERAAGALGIFDEVAALSARSEADAAGAVLEIVGKQ